LHRIVARPEHAEEKGRYCDMMSAIIRAPRIVQIGINQHR